MTTTPCPPVLMLIFRRPDITRQVFARIRDARPSQLFVAADGPRADRPGEEALCREARAIVAEVDWPCQVHTLFREQNLGPGVAVSTAVTWFFECVEEGIVLEDDCVPDPSFFRFCAELLERYRDTRQIMMISGNNHQDDFPLADAYSYFYSVFSFVWGWATWRRAWRLFDTTLTQWPDHTTRNKIAEHVGDPLIYEHYAALLNQVYAGEFPNWDYAWTYACWRHEGYSVTPTRNLVMNIGTDIHATHGAVGEAPSIPARPLAFPLAHPPRIERNIAADRYIFTRRILRNKEDISGRIRTLIRAKLHPNAYRLLSRIYRAGRVLRRAQH